MEESNTTKLPLLLDDAINAVLDQIETIAHNLAEAAGIYGLHYVSLDASAIADAVLAEIDPMPALDNFLHGMNSEID